ncbi:src-like-adapter 2 [Dinothrombium tinctorium]|uniref:Src-like-adapter 2 n=1 Tax=Dinothrombium tinctorium TaxID=1965070 RepID=A0A443RKH3_9ACAR|nr:src-like-adapter 2 [Dinothrombium tinctorium]
MQSRHSQLVDRQDYLKTKAQLAGASGNCRQQHQQQAQTKFMLRFLPWCRLRRKMVLRDAASCDDFSSVIMKKEQSTKIFGPKCVKPVRKQQSFDSNSSYPVVSFVNKGDGLVSMDLVDTVMVNENELYSMSVVTNSNSSNFSSMHSLSNVSSSVSSKSTKTFSFPPTPPLRNDSLDDCDSEIPDWYYGSICRDSALNILQREPIGAFVVRDSSSKPGCYALSIRVPKQFQVSGVAHYLIIRSAKGTFKIKGFTKEFSSLHSLIVHHSIMQELLPCPLNLSVIRKRKVNNRKQSTADDLELITTCNSNTEVLVDIDSDPDYQRILSSFRKSMASCK